MYWNNRRCYDNCVNPRGRISSNWNWNRGNRPYYVVPRRYAYESNDFGSSDLGRQQNPNYQSHAPPTEMHGRPSTSYRGLRYNRCYSGYDRRSFERPRKRSHLDDVFLENYDSDEYEEIPENCYSRCSSRKPVLTDIKITESTKAYIKNSSTPHVDVPKSSLNNHPTDTRTESPKFNTEGGLQKSKLETSEKQESDVCTSSVVNENTSLDDENTCLSSTLTKCQSDAEKTVPQLNAVVPKRQNDLLNLLDSIRKEIEIKISPGTQESCNVPFSELPKNKDKEPVNDSMSGSYQNGRHIDIEDRKGIRINPGECIEISSDDDLEFVPPCANSTKNKIALTVSSEPKDLRPEKSINNENATKNEKTEACAIPKSTIKSTSSDFIQTIVLSSPEEEVNSISIQTNESFLETNPNLKPALNSPQKRKISSEDAAQKKKRRDNLEVEDILKEIDDALEQIEEKNTNKQFRGRSKSVSKEVCKKVTLRKVKSLSSLFNMDNNVKINFEPLNHTEDLLKVLEGTDDQSIASDVPEKETYTDKSDVASKKLPAEKAKKTIRGIKNSNNMLGHFSEDSSESTINRTSKNIKHSLKLIKSIDDDDDSVICHKKKKPKKIESSDEESDNTNSSSGQHTKDKVKLHKKRKYYNDNSSQQKSKKDSIKEKNKQRRKTLADASLATGFSPKKIHTPPSSVSKELAKKTQVGAQNPAKVSIRRRTFASASEISPANLDNKDIENELLKMKVTSLFGEDVLDLKVDKKINKKYEQKTARCMSVDSGCNEPQEECTTKEVKKNLNICKPLSINIEPLTTKNQVPRISEKATNSIKPAVTVNCKLGKSKSEVDRSHKKDKSLLKQNQTTGKQIDSTKKTKKSGDKNKVRSNIRKTAKPTNSEEHGNTKPKRSSEIVRIEKNSAILQNSNYSKLQTKSIVHSVVENEKSKSKTENRNTETTEIGSKNTTKEQTLDADNHYNIPTEIQSIVHSVIVENEKSKSKTENRKTETTETTEIGSKNTTKEQTLYADNQYNNVAESEKVKNLYLSSFNNFDPKHLKQTSMSISPRKFLERYRCKSSGHEKSEVKAKTKTISTTEVTLELKKARQMLLQENFEIYDCFECQLTHPEEFSVSFVSNNCVEMAFYTDSPQYGENPMIVKQHFKHKNNTEAAVIKTEIGFDKLNQENSSHSPERVTLYRSEETTDPLGECQAVAASLNEDVVLINNRKNANFKIEKKEEPEEPDEQNKNVEKSSSQCETQKAAAENLTATSIIEYSKSAPHATHIRTSVNVNNRTTQNPLSRAIIEDPTSDLEKTLPQPFASKTAHATPIANTRSAVAQSCVPPQMHNTSHVASSVNQRNINSQETVPPMQCISSVPLVAMQQQPPSNTQMNHSNTPHFRISIPQNLAGFQTNSVQTVPQSVAPKQRPEKNKQKTVTNTVNPITANVREKIKEIFTHYTYMYYVLKIAENNYRAFLKSQQSLYNFVGDLNRFEMYCTETMQVYSDKLYNGLKELNINANDRDIIQCVVYLPKVVEGNFQRLNLNVPLAKIAVIMELLMKHHANKYLAVPCFAKLYKCLEIMRQTQQVESTPAQQLIIEAPVTLNTLINAPTAQEQRSQVQQIAQPTNNRTNSSYEPLSAGHNMMHERPVHVHASQYYNQGVSTVTFAQELQTPQVNASNFPAALSYQQPIGRNMQNLPGNFYTPQQQLQNSVVPDRRSSTDNQEALYGMPRPPGYANVTNGAYSPNTFRTAPTSIPNRQLLPCSNNTISQQINNANNTAVSHSSGRSSNQPIMPRMIWAPPAASGPAPNYGNASNTMYNVNASRVPAQNNMPQQPSNTNVINNVPVRYSSGDNQQINSGVPGTPHMPNYGNTNRTMCNPNTPRAAVATYNRQPLTQQSSHVSAINTVPFTNSSVNNPTQQAYANSGLYNPNTQRAAVSSYSNVPPQHLMNQNVHSNSLQYPRISAETYNLHQVQLSSSNQHRATRESTLTCQNDFSVNRPTSQPAVTNRDRPTKQTPPSNLINLLNAYTTTPPQPIPEVDFRVHLPYSQPNNVPLNSVVPTNSPIGQPPHKTGQTSQSSIQATVNISQQVASRSNAAVTNSSSMTNNGAISSPSIFPTAKVTTPQPMNLVSNSIVANPARDKTPHITSTAEENSTNSPGNDSEDVIIINDELQNIEDPGAMNVIDLTWMDEIKQEEINEAITFVEIKKENQQDRLNDAISPADSGVASPDIQGENTLYIQRVCICAKLAVYYCRCQNMWYCSRTCQLADWDSHRLVCQGSQLEV